MELTVNYSQSGSKVPVLESFCVYLQSLRQLKASAWVHALIETFEMICGEFQTRLPHLIHYLIVPDLN